MTAVREASPLGRPLQPILLCAYDVDTEPIFNSLDEVECASDSDLLLPCANWRTAKLSGEMALSQRHPSSETGKVVSDVDGSIVYR